MKILIVLIINLLCSLSFAQNISIGPNFYELAMQLTLDADQSLDPKWKYQLFLTDNQAPKLYLAIDMPDTYHLEGYQQSESVYNHYLPINNGNNRFDLKIKNKQNKVISSGVLFIRLTPSQNLVLTSPKCSNTTSSVIKEKSKSVWLFNNCSQENIISYDILGHKTLSKQKIIDRKNSTSSVYETKSNQSFFTSLDLWTSFFDTEANKDQSFLGFALNKKMTFLFMDFDFGINLDAINLNKPFDKYQVDISTKISLSRFKMGSNYFYFKPYLKIDQVIQKDIAFAYRSYSFVYTGIELYNGNFSVFYNTALISSLHSNNSREYGLKYKPSHLSFNLIINDTNEYHTSFKRYQLSISKEF